VTTTRRGFLVASGGLVIATAGAPSRLVGQAIASSGVPTFESMFGTPLGVAQAGSRQLDEYVRAVARASPRVLTNVLRPASVHGNPLRYAVVSHPDNLARLDEIARRTRALRLMPPPDREAVRHAREQPAIASIIANVHGNEPSGADATAQLLYELAARDDEENVRRLRELVIVLMPVQNPDGRNLSQRPNANGFDPNRDWFALTQNETVGKIALYSHFPPVVSADLHEQFGSPPNTYFFPPYSDPLLHECSRAGLEAQDKVISPAVERAFTAKGHAYEHYKTYDLFYPGYGDCTPNQAFGAAGMVYEQENAEV
jgi:hypothetical protein